MGGTKTGNAQAAGDASVMLKMKDSKIRILEEQVQREEGGRTCDADVARSGRLSYKY